VPDLSLEEASAWKAACDASDVATIFLVAPSTSKERSRWWPSRARDSCTVRAHGVPGKPPTSRGAPCGHHIREMTDVPTYVGIGISNRSSRDAAE